MSNRNQDTHGLSPQGNESAHVATESDPREGGGFRSLETGTFEPRPDHEQGLPFEYQKNIPGESPGIEALR